MEGRGLVIPFLHIRKLRSMITKGLTKVIQSVYTLLACISFKELDIEKV